MRNLFNCITICFLCSSCAVYYPHLNTIPLIEEKGEMQVSASIGLSPANACINYSPLEHFAVHAAGDFSKKCKSFSIGAGGYGKFTNGLKYEVYPEFTYGTGDGSNIMEETGDSYRLNTYQQYATCINIGKATINKKLEYAFSLKPFYLHSYGKYYFDDSWDIIQIKDNSIGVEPGISLKLGRKKLRFKMQASWCFLHKFTYKDYDKYSYYSPLNVGIGLNYRFNIINK